MSKEEEFRIYMEKYLAKLNDMFHKCKDWQSNEALLLEGEITGIENIRNHFVDIFEL